MNTLLLSLVLAADFYVSPTGHGSGLIDDPWSLSTALAQPPAVASAVASESVTIWLRGGTYLGNFTSSLRGTSSHTIDVRPYPGEPVVIKGGTALRTNTLTINGSYSRWFNLEITGSLDECSRITLETGSSPTMCGGEGLYIECPNCLIANCYVHDNRSNGIGFWSTSTNSELYGNIVVNNGWDAPDRAHGHALYTQNDTGLKKITQNLLLGSVSGYVNHQYTEGGAIKNYLYANNLWVGGTMLMGGYQPMQNQTIIGNRNFGGELKLGYAAASNQALTMTGNYFTSMPAAYWWDAITSSGNWFLQSPLNHSADLAVKRQQGSSNPATLTLDYDTWGPLTPAYPSAQGVITVDGVNSTFAYLQSVGQEAHGTLLSSLPTSTVIFYDQNIYESGRCHATVFNWANTDTVSLDLSQCGYIAGDQYQIQDAMAMGEPPLTTGAYTGGSVSVNAAYAGFTLPQGSLGPSCWSAGCSTCSPVPSGCSTHAMYAPTKTSKKFRVYLIRKAQST